MTIKRNKRDAVDQISEALELLFGSEDELTDEELNADLRELGVDRAVLEHKAHQDLREMARHHFTSLDKEVPREMNTAIGQLRPLSLEQKHAKWKALAQQRIEDVVQAVRTPGFLGTLTAAEMRPQISFRNRAELSDSDLELLEKEQAEIDNPPDIARGRDDE